MGSLLVALDQAQIRARIAYQRKKAHYFCLFASRVTLLLHGKLCDALQLVEHLVTLQVWGNWDY